MLKVGSTLCDIDVEGGEGEEAKALPIEQATAAVEPSLPAPSPLPADPPSPPSHESSDAPLISNIDVFATPATRRLAREIGVDLSQIKGTGRDGRIVNEDVLAAAKASPSTASSSTIARSASAPAPPPPASPPPSSNSTTTVPLSSTRRAMFRAMTSSLSIPHFAYSDTLDVTELERLRLRLSTQIPLHLRKTLSTAEEMVLARRAQWGSAGGAERVEETKRIDRVTLLPLLLKALSLAVAEHPLFLCSLSPSSAADADPALISRSSHDISIALSSPSPSGGLFTPVLRSVESSSVFTIASQLAFLQSHLSASSSTPPRFPPEHQGAGTLTLSNVGVVGGRTTHPVIPPTGQLAIGAVGRVRVEPRFVDEDGAKRVALGGKGGGEELKVEPRLLLVRSRFPSCLSPADLDQQYVGWCTDTSPTQQDASFTADHRVVEGVELARLVETWKRIVEDPSRLMA
jgi:2-oxoisovalerate dehydrogenase E2 component (dihydrolipoyl transacylase)